MDLSIVIVNYRSRKKLEVCLASIFQADNKNLNYEIILVENNSGEDLSDLVSGRANLRLIVSAKNLGMGGGNNLGIEAARGEYIFILNPDTIIQNGAIATLFNYLKNNPGVGIVGPKLMNTDGSLQYSCSRFPKVYMPILRRTFFGKYFAVLRDHYQMMEFDHNSIKEVDWLMGSALMFKKKLSLADGTFWEPRFDEFFFMYFEDTDLCRTAGQKGFKVVYNSEAVLTHDHARQSAKYPWYLAIFLDRLAWRHINSWIKYFYKWGIKF
ncbi:MAG: glycosyltransferase [Patescibacteria group bacterium]